jgi:hypothetical protein
MILVLLKVSSCDSVIYDLNPCARKYFVPECDSLKHKITHVGDLGFRM